MLLAPPTHGGQEREAVWWVKGSEERVPRLCPSHPESHSPVMILGIQAEPQSCGLSHSPTQWQTLTLSAQPRAGHWSMQSRCSVSDRRKINQQSRSGESDSVLPGQSWEGGSPGVSNSGHGQQWSLPGQPRAARGELLLLQDDGAPAVAFCRQRWWRAPRPQRSEGREVGDTRGLAYMTSGGPVGEDKTPGWDCHLQASSISPALAFPGEAELGMQNRVEARQNWV